MIRLKTKIHLNVDPLEKIFHVACRRPVLYSLEISMKAMPDPWCSLMQGDPDSRLGEIDRGNKSRRTRTDDVY